MKTRIGLIGAGVIGRALFECVQGLDTAEIKYVLVGNRSERTGIDALDGLRTSNVEEALAHDVDIVVEAAHPAVLAAIGTSILARSDLCGFSCTALADPECEKAIRAAAADSGSHFFLPHGAILGLDGLTDGRDLLETVTITTTKSGRSLGVAADARGTIFDGSTRDACKVFPRNVNVHAAVALSGIGFDRTRSIVVADPDTTEMKHHIAAVAEGMAWEIAVRSTSLGGVSGSFTPRSATGSLRRILGLLSITNV